MLTETEEIELEFILEDLRREFLDDVDEGEYDFIALTVNKAQRALQQLMNKVVSRKVRGR